MLTVGRGPRLRLAAELGSDAVVDYQRDDPVAALRSATAAGRNDTLISWAPLLGAPAGRARHPHPRDRL